MTLHSGVQGLGWQNVNLTVCTSTDDAVLSAEQGSVEDRLCKDPRYGSGGGKEHNVPRALLFGSQTTPERQEATNEAGSSDGEHCQQGVGVACLSTPVAQV